MGNKINQNQKGPVTPSKNQPINESTKRPTTGGAYDSNRGLVVKNTDTPPPNPNRGNKSGNK